MQQAIYYGEYGTYIRGGWRSLNITMINENHYGAVNNWSKVCKIYILVPPPQKKGQSDYCKWIVM